MERYIYYLELVLGDGRRVRYGGFDSYTKAEDIAVRLWNFANDNGIIITIKKEVLWENM